MLETSSHADSPGQPVCLGFLGVNRTTTQQLKDCPSETAKRNKYFFYPYHSRNSFSLGLQAEQTSYLPEHPHRHRQDSGLPYESAVTMPWAKVADCNVWETGKAAENEVVGLPVSFRREEEFLKC